VIGANLGSGLLAMINASGSNAAGKRVALGSLLFKLIGCVFILPFVDIVAEWLDKLPVNDEELVIFFHVFYNLIRCVAMVPFADLMARLCR
ncbi:Na/Pi cotransporter family protein, partial [Pseudomonas sp. SIMBA_065]